MSVNGRTRRLWSSTDVGYGSRVAGGPAAKRRSAEIQIRSSVAHMQPGGAGHRENSQTNTRHGVRRLRPVMDLVFYSRFQQADSCLSSHSVGLSWVARTFGHSGKVSNLEKWRYYDTSRLAAASVPFLSSFSGRISSPIQTSAERGHRGRTMSTAGVRVLWPRLLLLLCVGSLPACHVAAPAGCRTGERITCALEWDDNQIPTWDPVPLKMRLLPFLDSTEGLLCLWSCILPWREGCSEGARSDGPHREWGQLCASLAFFFRLSS